MILWFYGSFSMCISCIVLVVPVVLVVLVVCSSCSSCSTCCSIMLLITNIQYLTICMHSYPHDCIYRTIILFTFSPLSSSSHMRLYGACFRKVQLSPGQLIATYQHSISQHCWPSICELRLNDGNIPAQHIATLLGAMRAFGHPVGLMGSTL